MRPQPAKAEIIAVGSEFLHGGRTESNSLFLAEGLAKCGVEVYWKTLVGDNVNNIIAVFMLAVRRANVIVVTGGLGSTVDDCTREAIAKMTGYELRRRHGVLKALKTYYASRGRKLTNAISRQAYLPVGAEMLRNSVGSAPGFLLEWKRCVIIALPGVSKEAQVMFETQGIPRLHTRFSEVAALRQRTILTIGLTELEIDRRLQPLLQQNPSVELSLLASPLGVAVILREWVSSQSDLLERLVSHGIELLGDHVYAEQAQTIESVVGRHLQSTSMKLALAESCTGGLIAHRLTQVPGSSSYVDRGYVCYSNQAKQDLLGVPLNILKRNGAVSAPVAKIMAIGARERSHSDVGLSVTGIAGPGGGSVKKPVGLVFVGLDGPYGTYTKKFQFHGDRQDVKMRASQAALNLLRLYLLGRLQS